MPSKLLKLSRDRAAQFFVWFGQLPSNFLCTGATLKYTE